MSIVTDAMKLHRRGKYHAALELLETNILLHRDEPEFLFQLVLSYIYTQDHRAAQEILDKITNMQRGDNSAVYLNAILALLNEDSQRALDIWVNLLKNNENDAIARRGLELLKTQSATKIKSSYNRYRVLRTLIPNTLKHTTVARPLVVAISVALLLLVAGVATMLVTNIDVPRLFSPKQLTIQDVPIQQTEMIAISKASRYLLNDEEITHMLQRIQQAFNAFDDTEVCRLINYMQHANITPSLHNKLTSISQLLKMPTFISLTDSVEFAEVAASPWLYHTCYVRWSGRAVGVQSPSDSATQFSLYVGYEDTSILEGVVPSYMAIEYGIQEAEAVELIGQLTISDADFIALEVIDVRPLYQ